MLKLWSKIVSDYRSFFWTIWFDRPWLSGNQCRTRDVSQLVERLLSMHKALVQFPALHKPGVVGHTYNLFTWVEGQWRPEDPKFKVTSAYTGSSRSSWVTLPFLQKKEISVETVWCCKSVTQHSEDWVRSSRSAWFHPEGCKRWKFLWETLP